MPPGSATAVGDADLLTVSTGALPATVTVALSESLTGSPSSSVPDAVTVSVGDSPALPATCTVKLHEYVAAGAIVCGITQSPWPFKLP